MNVSTPLVDDFDMGADGRMVGVRVEKRYLGVEATRQAEVAGVQAADVFEPRSDDSFKADVECFGDALVDGQPDERDPIRQRFRHGNRWVAAVVDHEHIELRGFVPQRIEGSLEAVLPVEHWN